MARIRLVHWKAAEAAPRVDFLRNAGHDVIYEEKLTSPSALRAGSPEAIVIDLTRMPSHGREVAVYLRGTKSTRHIPLVFAGGEAEKVAQIRSLLPDAGYAEWDNLIPELKKTLASPRTEPVVPAQMMSRYANRTVSQKLGIAAGIVVTVIDTPRDFPDLLGPIPEGVRFEDDERRPGPVTLWFVQDAPAFQASVRSRRSIARRSKLWIVWPKGELGKRAGITQNVVRDTALDVGLVDYKICAVNETWSAILFAAAKGA